MHLDPHRPEHREPGVAARLDSIDGMEHALREHGYLADPGLATALHLCLRMHRPILLEGEPGVGKTEVARTLARMFDGPLIRLQCYEGIEASQALYEWDYARQMLYVRGLGDTHHDVRDVYSDQFLIARPLLEAIRTTGPRVLLIDELDRADDEFDAFLLEALDDYGVTIPEIGRFSAADPPAVVITSNRTRELHDAIKRRCLYHWIDFPDPEREAEIIRLRAPDVGEALARSVAETVAELRRSDLTKAPGAAEAIDWAHALALLGADRARGEAAITTLGWAVKSREDRDRARAVLEAAQ